LEKQHTLIQASMSSLIGLIILNWAMIQALFAQIPPNPPGQFGPYIASTLALAAVSLYLAVGLMCLLSAGPQKFFVEPNVKSLAPVIILGTTFSIILIICSILSLKRKIE
jgi:hypothetical protein